MPPTSSGDRHHLPPEPVPSRRTHRFPKYTGNCFARFSPPPDRISAILGFPEPQLSVSEFLSPYPLTPPTTSLIRMHPNTEFTAKIASYCDEICDLDLAQSRGPTDIRSFLSIPTTSPMLNMPPCHEESPTFVTISYPTEFTAKAGSAARSRKSSSSNLFSRPPIPVFG